MTRAERQKEWEQRIAKYRASGQSVTEWCAANDVNPERLWYWLRKYKTPKETAPFMKSTQWLPVEISGQIEEMPNSDIADHEVLDRLLPWSTALPDACRMNK